MNGGLIHDGSSLPQGLVLPAAAGHVWNFSAFFNAPPLPADGVSFNLMNNNYMTNCRTPNFPLSLAPVPFI